MRPLIESLAALEVQIRQSTKLLTARAAADPLASRLMTLPGVEPITALTSRAASRIRRGSTGGEDVGAFAGLVPRRNRSGERDYKGVFSRPVIAFFDRGSRKRPTACWSGQAGLSAADVVQSAGCYQRTKARPRRRRPQTGHSAPRPLAIENRVLLELTTAAPDRTPKTGA